MTAGDRHAARAAGTRAARRRRLVRAAVAVAAALALFGLGIAVGRASRDAAPPAGTETLVRTLTPLPLPAAPGAEGP